MSKKIVLGLFCALAGVLSSQIQASYAQSGPAATPQQQMRPAGIPDDLHLVLMIKDSLLALNQANLTGNYSVLRDMGTPNFQMTNSSARLAEAFATMRARKLDLAPILFYNPKLNTPPALQEGEVLRLTGFFPTTPEQVNFELAFQLFAERWMLAGIAVNTAPPSAEGPQASAAPITSGAVADNNAPAKPSEAKPIRIDLSQPAQPQGQAAPQKKPAAKKPKPQAQQTAAAHSSQSTQKPTEDEPAAQEKPAPKPSESGSSWNPFAR